VNNSGYIAGRSINGPPASGGSDDVQTDASGYWTLEQCVQAYTTYLDSKQAEIEDQQTARRYRHAAQSTAEQIRALNDRKQPVVTYNRFGRKIDGTAIAYLFDEQNGFADNRELAKRLVTAFEKSMWSLESGSFSADCSPAPAPQAKCTNADLDPKIPPACKPPPIRGRKTESANPRYGEGFFSKLLE